MLAKLIRYVIKKIKARIFRPLSQIMKSETTDKYQTLLNNVNNNCQKTGQHPIVSNSLKIKYKSEKGYKLLKNKTSDACYDICTVDSVTLRKGTRTKLKTGIYIEIPENYEIQVRSRSGMALNHGIFVLNSPGTIDSGYRGEIQIILQNVSTDDYRIESGNKIAQLKISKVEFTDLELVDEIDLNTDRGEKGFGSSGA